MANVVSKDKQIGVISMLGKGSSLRAFARVTDLAFRVGKAARS